MRKFSVRLWGWCENDSVTNLCVIPFVPFAGLIFENKFADDCLVKVVSCRYDIDEGWFNCDVEFLCPRDLDRVLELTMEELIPYDWRRP